MAKDAKPRAKVVPSESGAPPAIVLPCPPDQFREFIAGLLGRPQTISRYFVEPIEVGRADAENLYHLLEQRISSQNDATLVQFTARIVYDDDSSVLLNSFSDFAAYQEIKPLMSTGLHLSWTYLVQFQNKSFPEKQTIDVSFRAQPADGSDVRYINEVWSFPGIRQPYLPAYIRIQHTDRTWGTDIEALLSGQIKTLEQAVSRARRFANEWSGTIGFLTAASAILSSLVLS
jgi:hypothetical protein